MNKRKILIIVLGILIIITAIVMCMLLSNKSNNEESTEPLAQNNNSNIPQGFKTIETETGLVIEDDNGNQFVWIPVDGTNVTLTRKKFLGGIKNVADKETIDRIYYGEESPFACIYKYKKQEENYKYCIDYFKESVQKYGGFYISRYEVSDELAQSERTENSEGKIASKAGYYPYTYISREEALKKSMEMYKDHTNVVSSLINSYAWDTTLQFINQTQEGYLDSKPNEEITTIQKTGESTDEVCNIFDLAGNVSEWTTEYSNNGYYTYTSPCVQRGESYQSKILNSTSRFYNGQNVKNGYIGFRVVLYL